MSKASAVHPASLVLSAILGVMILVCSVLAESTVSGGQRPPSPAERRGAPAPNRDLSSPYVYLGGPVVVHDAQGDIDWRATHDINDELNRKRAALTGHRTSPASDVVPLGQFEGGLVVVVVVALALLVGRRAPAPASVGAERDQRQPPRPAVFEGAARLRRRRSAQCLGRKSVPIPPPGSMPLRAAVYCRSPGWRGVSKPTLSWRRRSHGGWRDEAWPWSDAPCYLTSGSQGGLRRAWPES